MKYKLLIIAGALGVIGAAAGGRAVLLLPGPDVDVCGSDAQLFYFAGRPCRHGNDGTECGLQSRRGCCALASRRAASASATAGDWPSYNRTLTSERYSPLSQINTKNVGKLKVLCTYDVGQFAAFESGLIMVDNALIGTTEFDIFSLNPATCARELANARGLSSQPSAGQPRRRLHGRHAVSRHPGRAGAGL